MEEKNLVAFERVLNETKPVLADVLPKHINPARMMQILHNCFTQTPKLKQCTENSLFGALVACCQLGLEPNTVEQLAFIIPYGNKATFVPGYPGLIRLALQSGMVTSVNPHLVYANDLFEISLGTQPEIKHQPCLKIKERGELLGGYCVVFLTNGGYLSRWMPIEEIDKAKPNYVTDDSESPWNSHPDEMRLKTLVRRGLKTAPKSTALSRAIDADEIAMDGRGHWEFDPALKDVKLIESKPVEEKPPIPMPEREEPKEKPKEEPKKSSSSGERKITAKQITRLEKISGKAGYSDVELHDLMKEKFGFESVEDIPMKNYNKICEPFLEMIGDNK